MKAKTLIVAIALCGILPTTSNCMSPTPSEKIDVVQEDGKTDTVLTSVEIPQTLTLTMTGDIMMGTTYPSVQLPANDGKDLFKDCKQILKNADLALGNLEGAICDGGKSAKGSGKNSYSFRTPTSYTSLLSDAGYDYLCMANNHARDFGVYGIESTESALDKEGILYSGIAGRVESVIIERKGKKIGICAFGHNSYTLKHTDLKTVERIVDTLVSKTDIVVVTFHGGAEGRDKLHLPHGTETFLGENRGALRNLAHFCIDRGVDVVFGHGPHIVRAIEVYKGKFIAYSLGNFCTPYGMSLTGISGHAPVVEIKIDEDGNFVDGQIHSLIQTRGVGPRTDATNSVGKHIKNLSETDVPNSEAKIDENGYISLK